MTAQPEQCTSEFSMGPGARPRTVRCIQEQGHDGDHFATWGGSQKWRQIRWPNGEDDLTVRLHRMAEAVGESVTTLTRRLLEDAVDQFEREGIAGPTNDPTPLDTIDQVADAIADLLDVDPESIGINRAQPGRRPTAEIVLSAAHARHLAALARNTKETRRPRSTR